MPLPSNPRFDSPKSVFDLKYLEEAFRSPEFIEIPIPGGVMVMRPCKSPSEWGGLYDSIREWVTAMGDAFPDASLPTPRDWGIAYILRTYVVADGWGDMAAIEFVQKTGLLAADLVQRWENESRTLAKVNMSQVYEEKKTDSVTTDGDSPTSSPSKVAGSLTRSSSQARAPKGRKTN